MAQSSNVTRLPRNVPERVQTNESGAGADNEPGKLDDMSSCLVSVAETQDTAAFSSLFRHFAPRIKAWLLLSGERGDRAEDILQDTFAAIWKKARLYDCRRATAATWIFTIARNRRIDVLRKERRPEFDPADPAFTPDPEPCGEQVSMIRERSEIVRDALAGLSEEQREVLRLAYFEGESYSAVAARLDLPLGTVKSRIRLAFGHLRTALDSRVGDIQ